MLGKRASAQFDIGGETGYKSGLFAPRFWYDIYSFLNATPLEDWSQPIIEPKLFRYSVDPILSVQEDLGRVNFQKSFKKIIKNRNKRFADRGAKVNMNTLFKFIKTYGDVLNIQKNYSKINPIGFRKKIT